MKRRGDGNRSRSTCLAVFAGSLGAVLLLVVGAEAQQTPVEAAGLPGDTIELVFEREVFTYPAFERRNPFRPLTGVDAVGPRFEDLVLMGRILSSNPATSIALVGARPPGTSGQQAAQTYRLRVGDVLGNTRILEIREQVVLVEVEEFGLRETRILELQRGTGPVMTPPTATPQEPAEVPTDEPTPGQDVPDDVTPDDPAPDLSGARTPRNGNGGWT